jgi:hypothetical protein
MNTIPQKKRRNSTRFMRIMLYVLPLSFVPLAVFTLVTDYSNYAANDVIGLLGNLVRVELGRYWPQVLQGVGIYLLYVSTYRSLAYMGKQREQAEQMQASAPISLWTTADPALPLPFHVWVRAGRRMRIIQGIAPLIAALVLLVPTLLAWKEYGDWVSITTLGFYGGVIVLASVLMPLLFRSHFTITEQGISSSQAGFRRDIAWQDARFFVVRAIRESPKGRAEQYYMLEDTNGRKVIWRPLDKRMYRVFTSQQQTLTIAQFNDEILPQINALVAARTGLALIDQRVDASVELPIMASS